MLTFIKKAWIHGIIWAAMLVYVTISPDIYAKFILEEGKPVQFNKALPQPTDQMSFWVDRLDLIEAPGLYNLWGWSFFRGDKDQDAYERWVVLQSEENTYFYPARSFQRPELQSAFKDVDIDISNGGFSTHISKFAIEPAEYRIGILFEHKFSDAMHYIFTNHVLTRTANQMRLETLNK